MYLLLVSFVVKRIYIIIYLKNTCILLFNDSSVTTNRKTIDEYRDQPWFSVFKHSMDHEEGV